MNTSSDNRPTGGISLDEAFLAWSDAETIDKLRAIAGSADLPSLDNAQRKISDKSKCNEYMTERNKAEKAFCIQMSHGDKLLSGNLDGQFGRTVMPPAEWLEDALDVSFDLGDVASHMGTYKEAEFFEITNIPTNVIIPGWLKERIRRLPKLKVCVFDPSFRSGTFEGQAFKLEPLPARVMKALYEMTRDGDFIGVKNLLKRS